jgi:hypothetical protein
MELVLGCTYRTRDGRHVTLTSKSDSGLTFFGLLPDEDHPHLRRLDRTEAWNCDGSTPLDPQDTVRYEFPTDLIELVAAGDSTQATTFHALPVVDAMTPAAPAAGIGDVNSSAKGSGARYNAGKAPYELIPLKLIAESYLVMGDMEGEPWHAAIALDHLGDFQARGHVNSLYHAMRELGLASWEDCAKVFDYGRGKYKEWNWAKGMAWSVPIACAARHLLAIIRGEENDPESGLRHRGHVLCNLVMLLTFTETYLEGDDRPEAGLLAAANDEQKQAAA